MVPLSRREREVLALVAQGYGAKAIAGQLWISVKTVERHLWNIYYKLDIGSGQGMMRRMVAGRWWWQNVSRGENRNT